MVESMQRRSRTEMYLHFLLSLEQRPKNAQDLGMHTRINHAVVVEMMKRLIDHQLVYTTFERFLTNDRPCTIYYLTDKGKRVAQIIKQISFIFTIEDDIPSYVKKELEDTPSFVVHI